MQISTDAYLDLKWLLNVIFLINKGMQSVNIIHLNFTPLL